ncbi:MAG: GNAT family N-acetyltransferase [Solirubrobacteraceae bacterium]|jgi:RimJ/RimL family protein N-acetyltransferase
MSVELTPEIDPAWVPTILDLEYEASTPFYDFVFADEAAARRSQRILFDAGAGEWAPPYGHAFVEDGELVGLLGGALWNDLQRVRLAASLALARAGVFDDEELAHRMQLGVSCLAQPQEGDYYYGVVAVTPAARGSSVAAEIFELARQLARESGATRVVGQTLAENTRLVAYYERTGHHWIGEGRARDPQTGRELHYRHFAIAL